MKGTFIAIGIAGILIAAAFALPSLQGQNDGSGLVEANNTFMENGVQVIEIKAKGGYSPQNSQAVAGVPTVIRFNTQGTFDCSSALTIPSLGIQKNLPLSGTLDIPVGTPAAGPLFGSCDMGMYGFEVTFK